MSSGRRQNNQLPNNLPQLQNLIKRDADAYTDEFHQQYRQYKAMLDIFSLNPTEHNEMLDNLIMFLAQVALQYQTVLVQFPQELMNLLQRHSTVLNPDMRMCVCRALILLRNRGLISSIDLLPVFFQLLQCQDKSLRKFLELQIISDIKNKNSKHKNVRLNTTMQNSMYQRMRENNVKAVKMSLNIMIQLYHKNIWNDVNTVNVIADACLSKITKIAVTAMKFFLTNNIPKDEDEENESDDEDLERHITVATKVNKKSRSRKKQLEKTKTMLKNRKKKKNAVETYNFSALHLIRDPQAFAEKLYKKLQSLTGVKFEVKMLLMDLISRLIGVHQLFLENFYPYLIKYLRPRQQEVTRILLFAAQSSHDLVPPDEIQPVLRTVINEFVTERNGGDAMAIGLNTIREICSRCPLALGPEQLEDLIEYRNYKNRSVMMAARSLLKLYRITNPDLLRKRDRGRQTVAIAETKVRQYGERDVRDYIPGAEVLLKNDEEEQKDEDDEWETDSDSDGSSEWINVSHSDDEMETSTTENTETPGKALTPSERAELASEISKTHIFTDDDFRRIEVAQAEKQTELVRRGSAKKRKLEEEPVQGNTELIDLASIEMVHKRRHDDLAARMESAMRGKQGRDKFGRKRTRQNEHASTSNKEKKKTKAFMMIKHKVKKKVGRSFKEQQIALRNSLLKQKRRN